ncbi:OmpA family protein [Pontibacter sp. SGAir0037]|uniref:OmpA family protein n=1 Tax=Pontibacter sp. SGAir0037 TaxID=2571030 RepID=UPI001F0D064E|nr:OmpA family protein [Pontibacter sp. SGAir0037]
MFIWLGLYLLLPLTGISQKKHALLNPVNHSKTLKTPHSRFTAFDFPNLNKVNFYSAPKKLDAIYKYEKRKEYALALPLLEEYVFNFGVENFYKDTYLLWRLGQLYERQQEQEKAKALYRLVLKHHRADVREVKSYYDSLEANSKDYYVPLHYYYEMVEYRKTIAAFQPPKGVYTNMGDNINSSAADYGPAMHSNDNLLIFTSKRNTIGINGRINEDLFYTRKTSNGWEKAQSFGKPINSIYNEGSACLSRDGNTLYFARCDAPDGLGNCDIYVATKQKDGSWGNIENLGPNVNSSAWDSQPTLSTKEDTLYFASDRLDGFGLSDIYFTYKTRNGEWAPAQNMGPVINTRGSEVSPFFHPLYQVLYFSSTGHLYNFGDFDIYRSHRVRGKWQEPINVGPLVNGRGSEYYFAIDAASKNLFYARSEADDLQNLDLYSFPLPMEAHPLAVTKVQGMLLDSVNNKPLTGIISVIDLDNGVEISSKYARPDGSFEFNLIKDSRYMLIIESPDFFTYEREISLQQDTALHIIPTLINHKLPLVFKAIEFDKNQAQIKDSMRPVLDEVALFLINNPNYNLEIGGHTDMLGDNTINLALSQSRADAIKAYIEEKARLKSDGRIEAFGYGSSKPLREELTDEDRRINRRVEFKLLKREQQAIAK